MVSEPTPKTVDVTFNADTLFDFDKAELRPAGRAALNASLGKIADMSPETITVVGHTDRLGSDSYNRPAAPFRLPPSRAPPQVGWF